MQKNNVKLPPLIRVADIRMGQRLKVANDAEERSVA